MNKIAIIVPTIREEKFVDFMAAWVDIFAKHKATVYKVKDGEKPIVIKMAVGSSGVFSVKDIMGRRYSHLIYNFNDGVRNLGFAAAYRDKHDIFITLDDDTLPPLDFDPIQAHLDALSRRFPISWMNTTKDTYMRGFPYGIREEAECVLSHGVWVGVADFDASTQLLLGTPEQTFRQMPVPKGILFPMCIMNVAFKRCMMPFMYQAPMFKDINRFADIWAGIEAKKAIDERGWCAVTGFSHVIHERASDPFVNLVKEARGVGMNENYGNDEYFKLFRSQSLKWQQFLKQYEQ